MIAISTCVGKETDVRISQISKMENLQVAWILVGGILLASQVCAEQLLAQPKVAPSRDAVVTQGTTLGQTQQFEQDGVRIEFSLRTIESQGKQEAQVGQTALAEFSLRDSRTGQPLFIGNRKPG